GQFDFTVAVASRGYRRSESDGSAIAVDLRPGPACLPNALAGVLGAHPARGVSFPEPASRAPPLGTGGAGVDAAASHAQWPGPRRWTRTRSASPAPPRSLG